MRIAPRIPRPGPHPLALAAGTLVLVASLAACGATGSGSGEPDPGSGSADKPALFDELPEDIQQSGVIRNGADFTYPPMEFVADDGTTLTGVDHDLAEAVGEKLGVRIEHANSAFGSLIPMLQSKRADMVFSFATVTPERMEAVDFVEYSQSGTALMVKAGNPEGITSLEDLCGKAVGLQSGAVQVPIAEEASQECEDNGDEPIDIKQLGRDSEVQILLRSGRIAADLLDAPVAVYASGQEAGFEVVPDVQYEVRSHGIMVLKGNTELADALALAVQELMDDGTYAEILEKYDVPDIALEKAVVTSAE